MAKSDKTKKTKKQMLDATHLAEILTRAEYVDRRSYYLHNFFRGIVVGAGTVIGATVLIGLLLWILSFFDTVPLIGPTIDNARQTIETHQQK
jgi:hypothetical protein